MKKILAAAAMSTIGAVSAAAGGMEIRPNGSTPSVVGKTPDNFTGQAIITPLFPANETTRANAGLVTFTPGARTVWHTHPAGQLLFIISGQGWVQEDGKERRTVNAGDVVWFAAGVRHWHGATATSPMAHIAMTYEMDGKNVEWLEPVSDQQYRQ
jgi:quercetin dioxygenase-like cupin family protein